MFPAESPGKRAEAGMGPKGCGLTVCSETSLLQPQGESLISTLFLVSSLGIQLSAGWLDLYVP